MRWITVAGPPSSGKTAVLTKIVPLLGRRLGKVGVVKFDCTSSEDARFFAARGELARSAIAGALCPDHFFAASIPDLLAFGRENELELLITESAGLCSRCSPHVHGQLALCVIDALSGIETPRKIGPMLRTADVVAITKGDLLSQAERDVFLLRVDEAGRGAAVLFVNGLTGQGADELANLLAERAGEAGDGKDARLRFPMPAALCSYCLGETRLGSEFQMGNVPKLALAAPGPAREPRGEQSAPPPTRRDGPAAPRRPPPLASLTLLAGIGKQGQPEGFDALTLVPGDFVALVGRTGSGKTRLLADLEWLAQGDTPSRRRVLVDGRPPEARLRFSAATRLVAQLSQTMSFVMDVSVAELVSLHATCLGADSREDGIVEQVVDAANELTGEPLHPASMLASLSGGQSRALMIADLAILGRAPVVVIDEIENAGIDRLRAVQLLLRAQKIVLMATHDPLLALSAPKRWTMQRGALVATQTRTPEEAALVAELASMDRRLTALRSSLRDAEPLLGTTPTGAPSIRTSEHRHD